MSDMEKAKAIVRALRCTCTSGNECEGKACAYYLEEMVDEKTRALIGDTVWSDCDVDQIGLDAADMLEALMEDNDRLTHALKLQQLYAAFKAIDHDTMEMTNMAILNPEFKRLYMSRALSDYDSLPSGLLTGGYACKARPTISKTLGLRTDVCASCKKKFEHTNQHAYLRRRDNRSLLFCSYSCMRQYDARVQSGKEKGTQRTGRPTKSAAERIKSLQEKIEQDNAALASGLVGEESAKIRKRIGRHMRELMKIRRMEEAR